MTRPSITPRTGEPQSSATRTTTVTAVIKAIGRARRRSSPSESLVMELPIILWSPPETRASSGITDGEMRPPHDEGARKYQGPWLRLFYIRHLAEQRAEGPTGPNRPSP